MCGLICVPTSSPYPSSTIMSRSSTGVAKHGTSLQTTKPQSRQSLPDNGPKRSTTRAVGITATESAPDASGGIFMGDGLPPTPSVTEGGSALIAIGGSLSRWERGWGERFYSCSSFAMIRFWILSPQTNLGSADRIIRPVYQGDANERKIFKQCQGLFAEWSELTTADFDMDDPKGFRRSPWASGQNRPSSR